MSAHIGVRTPISFSGNNYKVVTAAGGEDDVEDVDDDTILTVMFRLLLFWGRIVYSIYMQLLIEI